ELQECGLLPALLGLLLVLLVVHGVPSVSHCPVRTAAYALVSSRKVLTGTRTRSECCALRCVPASPAAAFAKRMAIARAPCAPLAVFGLGLTPTRPWPPHDGLRVIEDGERRRSGGARLLAPPPALPPRP